MKNPFEYGGVVAGESFCNRRKELADLGRAIENSEKLFVFSERRMGKTSLVLRTMKNLPQDIICAYVDLWPTDGDASFAVAMARALTLALASTPQKLLEAARSFFSRFSPSISVDENGRPIVSFEISRRQPSPPDLDEVLSAPARIANARKKRVAVVLDEFQQILEYESDLVEKSLRSNIQQQKDSAYIFLGSRKHIIKKMVLDSSRPLYRAGGHYPLGPIGGKDWTTFIRDKFEAAGKQIDDSTIEAVCKLTEGHPFYTQHLCHVLWELCEPRLKVSQSMIEEAISILLRRESYAFTSMWDPFSKNAKRVLAGLAAEAPGIKPFSREFLQRYGLGSASNAQRAIDSLLTRDVIDQDDGSYVIVDRFFKIWINRLHYGG